MSLPKMMGRGAGRGSQGVSYNGNLKAIAFFHMDLGIGGAEKLIVSAAKGLAKSNELRVIVYTTRFDPDHCFAECKDQSFVIKQYGSFIPRTFIFGYFTLLASVLRCTYLWLCIWLLQIFKGIPKPDVLINDQLAMLTPLLKLLAPKVIFYCHFPEALMTTKAKVGFRGMYRKPLELLEKWGTNTVDVFLSNSEFCKNRALECYPNLKGGRIKVLYPSVVNLNESIVLTTRHLGVQNTPKDLRIKLNEDLCPENFFLSVNRFEFKKRHNVAITAFKLFKAECDDDDKYHLIIAGGYDVTLPENHNCFKELENQAQDIISRSGKKQVHILKSLDQESLDYLYAHAKGVLYTPQNEHFGIVPIEAMAWGTPCICERSGGPCETIIDEKTGYLVQGDPTSFAEAMMKLAKDELIDPLSVCRSQASRFGSGVFEKELRSIVFDLL